MADPPPRGSPNRVNPGIVPPDSASFVFNVQLAIHAKNLTRFLFI
jgi:hypothetical protein